MRTTSVTFKVKLLDGNFPCMKTISYHNQHKVTLSASYEVYDNTNSSGRKSLKVQYLDKELILVISLTFVVIINGCLKNSNVTIVSNNDVTVPSDSQDNAAANIIVSAGDSFDFVLHFLQTFFGSKPHVDLTGTKIISYSAFTIMGGQEVSQAPAMIFDDETIVI